MKNKNDRTINHLNGSYYTATEIVSLQSYLKCLTIEELRGIDNTIITRCHLKRAVENELHQRRYNERLTEEDIFNIIFEEELDKYILEGEEDETK